MAQHDDFDFSKLLRETIFGDEPQIPFQSALQGNQFGQQGGGDQPFTQKGGRNRQQFFESQFGSIFNQFLGQLGGALKRDTPVDQLPTFENFIGDFDFQGFSNQFSPVQRGLSQSRFAPRTQFRF